jgi:hypothetical protein
VVSRRRRLKWGNLWPRPAAGYIHSHHHYRVALEPAVMRSDEMGEFLAAAAHGLYTQASLLSVLYLKPTVMRSDEMWEFWVAAARGLYTQASSLLVCLWNRQ